MGLQKAMWDQDLEMKQEPNEKNQGTTSGQTGRDCDISEQQRARLGWLQDLHRRPRMTQALG